jgi:hypothetical protein
VNLSPADTEWVFLALMRPRNEPVQGNRHVTRDERHTFTDLFACEHSSCPASGAVMRAAR